MQQRLQRAVFQGVERQQNGGDDSLAGKVGSFRGNFEMGLAEMAGGDEGAP